MNKKTNLSKHSMPNHALRVITFVHVKCNKTNCHTQQFSSTTLQVPYVFQFNYITRTEMLLARYDALVSRLDALVYTAPDHALKQARVHIQCVKVVYSH